MGKKSKQKRNANKFWRILLLAALQLFPETDKKI